MKKLAFLVVLLSALSFGQTHTFAALDTSNRWTGPNTFTLTTTLGDVVITGICTGCVSSGSGYTTIQNASVAITQRSILNTLGALVCSDNAGNSSSDCKLATNAAVSNQYLTGIDASGNFLRKQIAYGELSGTPQLPVTKTSAASNWINSYDSVTGLFTATRPAYTDLTGLPQLAVTKASVSAQWLKSYDSTTGLFTSTQPLYSEISGTPQLAITKTAVASNWLRSYDSTTGLFTASQPAYTDITGTPTLPATLANATHKWLNSYSSVTGLFTQTQPDYTDLTGLPQLAVTKNAVASNWIRSYDSTTGLFTASQPAFTDISGVGSCAQEPAATGDVTSSGCAFTLATTIPNAHTFSGAITTPKLNKSCIVDGTTYTSAASALADTTNCVLP